VHGHVRLLVAYVKEVLCRSANENDVVQVYDGISFALATCVTSTCNVSPMVLVPDVMGVDELVTTVPAAASQMADAVTAAPGFTVTSSPFVM